MRADPCPQHGSTIIFSLHHRDTVVIEYAAGYSSEIEVRTPAQVVEGFLTPGDSHGMTGDIIYYSSKILDPDDPFLSLPHSTPANHMFFPRLGPIHNTYVFKTYIVFAAVL